MLCEQDLRQKRGSEQPEAGETLQRQKADATEQSKKVIPEYVMRLLNVPYLCLCKCVKPYVLIRHELNGEAMRHGMGANYVFKSCFTYHPRYSTS